MQRGCTIKRSPSSSRNDIGQILGFSVLERYRHDIAEELEPLFRTLVREEVQRFLIDRSRNLETQSQMQISPEVPLYQLTFKSPPKTPIFAGAKVRDCQGNPLQILLVGPTASHFSSPSPIRIELVVLDGDFPSHDHWTSYDFEKAIVKERTGRRPLLTGDVRNITMTGGVAMIGDFQFTDNSSWIRSRHFRIGVRVVSGSYQQTVIKETMTGKFTVKDHRGESYRKHYPPVLTDEVWRLDKIRKDGPFHNKLSENNVHTIQDFLKLWAVDHARLREILQGMTEKMWDRVIKHASTCDLGDKIYCYRRENYMIYVNSICQVVQINVGSNPFTLKDLPKNYKDHVLHLVQEAYQQWDNLREADEFGVNVASIQGRNLGQNGAGPMQWYPNSSPHSGLIEFKGDADEGSSSVSFQFDQVSSMEWSHEFDQIP